MDVLAQAGVVQLTKVHPRGVFWRAQDVLDVLDALAANPGKRNHALLTRILIRRTPGLRVSDLGFFAEPPIGIEPMTYSLRGHCLGRWWSLIVV